MTAALASVLDFQMFGVSSKGFGHKKAVTSFDSHF